MITPEFLALEEIRQRVLQDQLKEKVLDQMKSMQDEPWVFETKEDYAFSPWDFCRIIKKSQKWISMVAQSAS